jgi:hypothetical protein
MGPQPAPLNHPTRRFELHREVDPTGISGTGLVAEGVEFRDGTVVVRWLPSSTAEPTTVIHPRIANVQALHGHNGSSRIVWIDPRE